MITAIIETLNEEIDLAHALAALVPAATEGIIRDVIVVDRGSTDGTLEVADAAGCTIVDASRAGDARRLAVEQARGEWLLFAPARPVFEPEWQDDAMAFIDRALTGGRAQKRVAVFRGGRLPAGPLAWLRAVARGGATARLVSKSAWLAEPSRATASSAASPVSGARRGAA